MIRYHAWWLAAGLLAAVWACDRQGRDGPANEAADQPERNASQAVAKDAPAPQADLFLSIPPAEVFQRAKAEDKTVFMFFYSDNCPACRLMDALIFPDPRVADLLRRSTIPIRLDILQNRFLAVSYGINGVPASLFFRADGSLIDRIDGAPQLEAFLTLVADYARGRDGIQVAREQVLQAHFELAQRLLVKGQHEQALEEFVWVLDHAPASEGGSSDATAAQVIGSLVWLGQQYQPAKEVLDRRYAAARDYLLRGSAKLQDLKIFSITNRLTGRLADTLDVYDQIKAQRPNDPVLTVWKDEFFDALLEARRYQELAANTDIAETVDQLFREAKEIEPTPEDYSPLEYDQARQQHDAYLSFRASTYYQILLGLERHKEADALAQRLLEAVPGSRTLNALAWAGQLTGKPTEANLQQAREANKLTYGTNAAVVDTLARILAVRGQREEAVDLIKESMKYPRAPAEAAALQKCLADIQQQPPASPDST